MLANGADAVLHRRTAAIEDISLKGVDAFLSRADDAAERAGLQPALDVGIEGDVLLIDPADVLCGRPGEEPSECFLEQPRFLTSQREQMSPVPACCR